MLTQNDIFRIAMEQSSVDLGCRADDFLKNENVVVSSVKSENARKYLHLPFSCNLVCYGNNIVASIDESIREIVTYYINRYKPYHCFETPNMQVLNDALQEYGLRICFMAEYFLPDLSLLKPMECGFETRMLTHDDFADLYTSLWNNALCESRKELDVLGVGAYDGDKLIGLAACSADCDDMRQIGVDVLADYRKQGIASSLTSKLAIELLKQNKVPFYCAAWSNIASVRNAIKSGFRPAWVEMTAKEASLVDKLNAE